MKRSSRPPRPIALTIAGSDSGGGAGIQADVKTFTALGCHATTVLTCVTAQNPRAVTGVQALTPKLVQQQLAAVQAELPARAVKTGMLFSAGIIAAVAEFFAASPRTPLIVDPVMVATSGAVLLQPAAIRTLQARLLPRATLVTPNLDEAQLLLGRKLTTREHLLDAALELHETYGCAALVKGGHLRLGRAAVDVLYDGRRFTVLQARRILHVSTHGTGCTYAAAIAARLAHGSELAAAVATAKQFITTAIAQSYRAGRHLSLNQPAAGLARAVRVKS